MDAPDAADLRRRRRRRGVDAALLLAPTLAFLAAAPARSRRALAPEPLPEFDAWAACVPDGCAAYPVANEAHASRRPRGARTDAGRSTTGPRRRGRSASAPRRRRDPSADSPRLSSRLASTRPADDALRRYPWLASIVSIFFLIFLIGTWLGIASYGQNFYVRVRPGPEGGG